MRTAAIIGHGPSPEGRGWGHRIDACDVVVRMFDYGGPAVQPVKDFGQRYDVGVITNSPPYMAALAATEERPGEWWGYDPRAKWPAGDAAFTYAGIPVDVMDYRDGLAFARLLSGRAGEPRDLTRGTAAALHAMTAAGLYVVLVGFDAVHQGHDSPVPDYSEAREAHERAVFGHRSPVNFREHYAHRTDIHDWRIENAVLEQFGQRSKRWFEFAESIW